MHYADKNLMMWYYVKKDKEFKKENTQFRSEIEGEFKLSFSAYQVLEAIHRIAMHKYVDSFFQRTHGNHFTDIDRTINLIDKLNFSAQDTGPVLLSKIEQFISVKDAELKGSILGLDRIGLGTYLNDALLADDKKHFSSDYKKYLDAGDGKSLKTHLHEYFKVYLITSFAVFDEALPKLTNDLVKKNDVHRLISKRVIFYHKDLFAIGDGMTNDFSFEAIRTRLKDNHRNGRPVVDVFKSKLKKLHIMSDDLFKSLSGRP